jgi:hypothetical protein
MALTNEPPAGFTNGIPDELSGQQYKIYTLQDEIEDNSHFYDGKFWILPDGRWGWLVKIKSFRSGKQWKGAFVLWQHQGDPNVVWTSDVKYSFMNGNGLEQFWYEWPLGPDPGVANVYPYVNYGSCNMNVH